MIVISDASPFIALSRIDCFHLLRQLFPTIIIPPAVFDDVCIKGKGKPGEMELRKALEDGWITQRKPSGIISPPYQGMRSGEIEALSLFWEVKADFVLMDECPGRSRAAKEKIPWVGTLDLLLRAKRQGLIPEVKKYIMALHKAKFRMSPTVVKYVLTKANEF